MNALAIARKLVTKYGERGADLASNRHLMWHFWSLVRPKDVTAMERRDFWQRVSYRAHVLTTGVRPDRIAT